MNSDERREVRRERRRNARQAKREKADAPFDDFGLVADADSLYRAFQNSKKGVSWKESVQRFDASLLANIAELRRKLLAGESVQSRFVEFTLNERGKTRHIKSVHISERVVQKALCDEVLVPILSRPLIHDNGACVKGKGVHFAIQRLILHLSRFYRENKTNDGYALLVDFSKFFDNVDHAVLFALVDARVKDVRIRRIVRDFVSVFGDGKSLGLGSQVSQIAAVFYPDGLDHFIKEKLRIKFYGRYMDDLYLIHRDRDYLKYCLRQIKTVCDELKITVNERKTRIVKLKDGVSFLKGRYPLTESGKVLRLPHRDSAKRMRRKLVKFKALIDAGKMGYADLRTAYQSWRGNFRKRFNGGLHIRRMDELYNRLFIDDREAVKENGDVLSGKEKRQGLLPQKP